MKKALLGGFIVVDLALIGGSSFVLYSYIKRNLPPGQGMISGLSGAKGTSAFQTPISTASAISPIAGGATDTAARNILFSYRNPKAKQVAIRADFTGWKAIPMTRSSSGVWTHQASLTPGEYPYCYTVDDKTIKDPAAKRTKQIGRTLVSAIVVEARPKSR